MSDWRERLRAVVAGWALPPEEHAAIVDELEQHLEMQLAELRPRIGDAAALERIVAQVDDPALRDATVPPRYRPAASVQSSRMRGAGWPGIVRDVRYGWRSLAASPGSTAMAMIALALGIGLTTVMFTVIYGLLLRGLPYDHGDRIVQVLEANPSRGEPELRLSMHDFFAYRDAQRTFETFGAYMPAVSMNISGTEQPERVEGARVTAAALSMTRVQPSLGRSIRADDEVPGGELVVVLSHTLWRDRYAGDASILGRPVRLNGQPATVVGVMPDGFGFPNATKLWVPLRLNPASAPWGSGAQVIAVGRLRDGVTLAQAQTQLRGIGIRIAAEHPQTNEGVRPVAQPFIRSFLPARIYALLYAMFVAVGLVFLVACTNVANLLLARAAHRTREVAIRSALGASRVAIGRQFLVEALVLSTVAACLGALVAQVGIVMFRDAIAGQVPFWADFQLHPQVFLFVAFAAFTASVVSGLLPAVTAARTDIADVLKDQSLGSSSLRGGRLSRGLVVFELTLSAALLVVAALTTRSMLNLRSIDLGFRTRDVLTGRLTLSSSDAASRTAFFTRLEEAVPGIPGATAASISSGLPGTGWSEGQAVVDGETYTRASHQRIGLLAVTPGFFKTFDVPIVRGRMIAPDDRAGTLPVAVVSQSFIDEYFPKSDPIGRRINLSPDDTAASWVTIVGVMPTLYANRPALQAWPAEVITAFNQQPRGSAAIAIRSALDPAAVAQPLRTVVAALDRDLPVYSLMSMKEALAQATLPVRVFGGLFVVFGVAALVLASIGLYAVLAFSVSRREREMGIRLALGAAAADVIRLVIRGAAIQLALGISMGLVLGVAGASVARAILFGVQPTDPATIAIVVGTLAATGFAACIVPAMRATRADPVRSLRTE